MMCSRFPLKVVSSDDAIEAYAKLRGMTYTEAFPHAVEDAGKTMDAHLDCYIREGLSVVHDQTNLTTKKRQQVLSKIPSEYRKIAVVIEVHETVRQQRLSERVGKKIPDHVDERMRRTFTYPSLVEGWDVVVSGEGMLLTCYRQSGWPAR
jgi:cytidylate kinase